MKKRILCFGDSNTWGYVAGENFVRYPENVRWTSVLQNELGDDFTIIEEGYNGRTTVWHDHIEDRMCGADYFPACIDSHSPLDIVIIMLGTNDTKCCFPVNASNIAAGAARIALMAKNSPFGKEYGKNPKVLLISPIEIREPKFSGMFDEKSAEISKEFANTFKEQADIIGCDFLCGADIAEPDEKDGVHMTKEGHRAFGKAVAKKIKEMLTE